ncbi:peptidoglycan-binding domain-containing protein [Inquilinus sp. CAU 1745]|uniref:peptidoglycan-binding domain-containing protein n=1 Tax=Inquilinus sp. CAU 1745 TaxID=3140369 RepID=UPI00325B47B1
MLKTRLLTGAALLSLAVPATAMAQTGPHDGTYEYAASGGWRGTLEVATGSRGETFFTIHTQGEDQQRCSLFAEGRLEGDAVTVETAGGDGVVVLRFFPDNAEVEPSGSSADFCDPGGQLAGIYFPKDDQVTLQREDIRSVQFNLNKLGYEAGPTDGVMGDRTRTALRGFQEDAELPETGSISLETMYRLEERVNAATAAAADAPSGVALSEERPIGMAKPAGDRELNVEQLRDPPPPTLEWLTEIPREHIETLDRLYSEDVPAAIDWSNPPFEIALVDLDAEGSGAETDREILVYWNDTSMCGDQGCMLEVLRWDGDSYEPVFQSFARQVAIGEGFVEGVRPLILNAEDELVWNGESYEIEYYEPTPVR